ncbi:MAG: hypothetical protein ACRCZB_00760 [Bacteroidales bacterium]
MKKAKHGQAGCLSTSWQEIAGQARNDEQRGRGALQVELFYFTKALSL